MVQVVQMLLPHLEEQHATLDFCTPPALFVQRSINTLPICFTQVVMVLDLPACFPSYLSSEGPAERYC